MITTHVNQRFVRASSEQVWRAIVDPALTRQYFFDTGFADEPRAGAAYRSVFSDGGTAVEGVIEVCEPPRRLVQTWRVRYDERLAAEPPSRVSWTVQPAGEGLVLIRVEHGELAFSPLTWAAVRDGWVFVLDGLKSLVETGRPLPPRSPSGDESSVEQLEAHWHRRQGVEANNATLELIATPTAAPEDVVRGAYAAAYHWDRVPTKRPVNEGRALYLIGKAWWRAGRADLALDYGDRTLAACREHGLADFDLAYAHELRARALGSLGRGPEAAAAVAAAREVPIAEEQNAMILAADLADLVDAAGA